MTFDEPNFFNIDRYAQEFAEDEYSDSLAIVLNVAFQHPAQLPSLRLKGNNIGLRDYVRRWVNKYLNGYKNRPSQKTGNPRGTYPDPVMKEILSIQIPSISEVILEKIEDGHGYIMTIEGLVGDILEEYLSTKLDVLGWHCCWGTTIKSTDFCCGNGDLLQIKNSDNSENSSSSQIRNGTKIIKWARRVSSQENTFNWQSLREMVGVDDVSEDDFQEFLRRTVINNPDILHINPDSPLILDEVRTIR